MLKNELSNFQNMVSASQRTQQFDAVVVCSKRTPRYIVLQK